MSPKPTAYQERMKAVLREARLGSLKAMGELYERYHVNRLMIKGELVDLKSRFTQSLSKY